MILGQFDHLLSETETCGHDTVSKVTVRVRLQVLQMLSNFEVFPAWGKQMSENRTKAIQLNWVQYHFKAYYIQLLGFKHGLGEFSLPKIYIIQTCMKRKKVSQAVNHH